MRIALASMKRSLYKKNAAFTVIEMAMVVAIVGIVMAFAADAYHVYQKSQLGQTMDNNASTVTSAITNYLIQKGSYPCPARLNAKRDDPDYGMAGDCSVDPADLTSPANPFSPAFVDVGNCTNGICIEKGRDIDNMGGGVDCKVFEEGNMAAVMTAPPGKKYVSVVFASYGRPTGDCDSSFTADPTCNSSNSVAAVGASLVGKASGTMKVDDADDGGDFIRPCSGPYAPMLHPPGIDPTADKWLAVKVRYVNGSGGATTLVDFGGRAADNVFELPGWNSVQHDTYTPYVEIGASGLMTEFNGGFDFRSVSGTPEVFAEGDEIDVTWLNPQPAAVTFTPVINMVQPGRINGASASTHQMTTITVPGASLSGSCTPQTLDTGPGSAIPDGGNGPHVYKISGSFGTTADWGSGGSTVSILRIFENGMEIGPAHSAHADIGSLGGGRFSHYAWDSSGSNESIRLSATDNSDVRMNGKSYTYCIDSPLGQAVSKYTFTAATAGTYSLVNVGVSVNTNNTFLIGDKITWLKAAAAVPALTATRVRRGAVPFRTLSIPEYAAEDVYGMRLQYAVSEALAEIKTYDRNNGVIDVQDGSGKSFSEPKASTHYVIFSSGPDRAGGYSRDEGAQVFPCPAGTLDTENCNTSTAVPNNKAIYRAAEYSEAAGPTHFDDYMKFYSSVELPLWQLAGTGNGHIKDMIGAGGGASAGKIGIGLDPEDGIAPALQVLGDVYTPQNMKAARLCPKDTSGANCYDTALTTTCGAGYVTEFIGGAVNCAPVAQTGCKAGEVMTGISATGQVICTAGANCPATPGFVTCPGETVDLPAAAPGATQTLTSIGTYSEIVKCTGGVWKKVSESGRCTACTVAVNTSTTLACNGGVGVWTGNIPALLNDDCVAPSTTTPTGPGNCVCASGSANHAIVTCPRGYSGGSTDTYTPWICDSSAAGHWGSSVTSGACTCIDGYTYSDSPSCQAIGFGPTFGGTVTRTFTHHCFGTEWTSTNTNNCSCTGATSTQTLPCPAGQVGGIKQKGTYNCATSSWSWVTIQNTCGTALYTWRAIDTGNGPYGAPLVTHTGDNCTAAQKGQVTSCSKKTGASLFKYHQCQCQ